jgi:hypothetical protein
MKKLVYVNVVTIVTASTVLFGLVLLSLASSSMAQQSNQTSTTAGGGGTTAGNATNMTAAGNATTTISLQNLTNNQTGIAPIDGFVITQQWSPMLNIAPQTAAISHASCSEGQVVIGGGYHVSSPRVQILFDGPSLTANAYAVQAYNEESSPSFIQVYAICLIGGEITPEEAAQAFEAQEGSRQ